MNNEITMAKHEALSRAEKQGGDNPNTQPYMDSMAIFHLTYVVALVAEELNYMNITLVNILTKGGER